MASTGFLSGFTEFYRVSRDLTELNCVSTKFYLVLRGFVTVSIGLYRVLLYLVGSYIDSLSFTEFYWVLQRFSWIFTEFDWVWRVRFLCFKGGGIFFSFPFFFW